MIELEMQLKEPFAARQEDNPEEFVTFLGESTLKSPTVLPVGVVGFWILDKNPKRRCTYGMGRNASPGLNTLIFDLLTAAV